MKKLLIALFITVPFIIHSQVTIKGGAGICHVDGNPNSIADLNTQDIRSTCHFVIDTTNSTRLWYYKHDNNVGARWVNIDLSVTDSDTRQQNFRIENNKLKYNLVNVKTSQVISIDSSITLASLNIVQNITAGTGISVTNNSGVFNIVNTAPNATHTGEVTGSTTLTITNNAVTYAKIQQGPGLTVLGVTGNTTANYGPITAASDHQVLRRSGTGLTFGAVNLAQSNAVTGILSVSNGGTGVNTLTGIPVGTGTTAFNSVSSNTALQILRRNSANSGYEFVDPPFVTNATTAYPNIAAATAANVPLNGYFHASQNNTMGAVPGTLIRRIY